MGWLTEKCNACVQCPPFVYISFCKDAGGKNISVHLIWYSLTRVSCFVRGFLHEASPASHGPFYIPEEWTISPRLIFLDALPTLGFLMLFQVFSSHFPCFGGGPFRSEAYSEGGGTNAVAIGAGLVPPPLCCLTRDFPVRAVQWVEPAATHARARAQG